MIVSIMLCIAILPHRNVTLESYKKCAYSTINSCFEKLKLARTLTLPHLHDLSTALSIYFLMVVSVNILG